MRWRWIDLVLICLFSGFLSDSFGEGSRIQPKRYYPLKIHPNGKHLIDSKGKTFLMVADVAWQMLRKLGYTDAVNYMDIRKSQSFNTFLIELLPNLPNQKNYNKVAPFKNNNDITQPNKPYFDYLEKIVVAARQRNLLVGIVVSRKSWNVVFDTHDEQSWKEYGAYLGKRLAKYTNIIWIVSEEEYHNAAQFKAIAEGLRSANDEQLVASLSTCAPIPSIDSTHNRSDMKFIVPDSTVTFSEYIGLANWQKHSADHFPKPFLIANSEFPKEIADQSILLRNQAYQSVMSSAAGFCHMSTVKNFNPTWKKNITKDGAEYIDNFVKIMKGIPWEYMHPDNTSELLPDSLDKREIGIFSLSNQRMVMLYMPSGKPLKMDLTHMRGEEFKVVWYSPRTGKRWNGADVKPENEVILNPPDLQPEWDWILLVGSKSR